MDKSRALTIVTLAYVFATAVGIAGAWAFGASDPLRAAFIADIIATVAIFGWSVAYGNSSFYDAYWSVAPILIALYWAIFATDPDVPEGRQLLALAVVGIWGCRLTFNWARGWTGLAHEDWRYVNFQRDFPRAYWAISFSGIHMFPTLIVFLGLIPLYPALATGDRPLGPLDAIGVLVGGAGILFEWLADRQLRAFVTNDRAPEDILRTGLWSWSRHPNYFGENLVWWGIYCFGVAADPAFAWTIIGPIAITAMFLIVSIPLIEKRALERRPGYAQVISETSMIVPMPPRRR